MSICASSPGHLCLGVPRLHGERTGQACGPLWARGVLAAVLGAGPWPSDSPGPRSRRGRLWLLVAWRPTGHLTQGAARPQGVSLPGATRVSQQAPLLGAWRLSSHRLYKPGAALEVTHAEGTPGSSAMLPTPPLMAFVIQPW